MAKHVQGLTIIIILSFVFITIFQPLCLSAFLTGNSELIPLFNLRHYTVFAPLLMSMDIADFLYYAPIFSERNSSLPDPGTELTTIMSPNSTFFYPLGKIFEIMSKDRNYANPNINNPFLHDLFKFIFSFIVSSNGSFHSCHLPSRCNVSCVIS